MKLKEEFYKKIEKSLELDIEINSDTNFKELEDWDSLSAMVLIGLVSDEFSIVLNSDDIENITTVNSLMERIGFDKFS
jgi:acyl carrier protein